MSIMFRGFSNESRGDKVHLLDHMFLQALSFSPQLEVGKEYKMFVGGELIGWFTRNEPLTKDKQIVYNGDYKPVQPLEYIELKFNI